MQYLYNIVIRLYGAVIGVVALFSSKAQKRHIGGRAALRYLKKKIDPNVSYVWFHAASLGEFEQGRPLMEALKRKRPDAKILLTFFSPSGFEIRKNYEGADAVCYLPLDTPENVSNFFEIVNVQCAIFIKYEFWANYLKKLRELKIPTYLVSGVFREKQMFFRPSGKFFRTMLMSFTRMFVQDVSSKNLLASIGLTNVDVAGDTRFDRVIEIAGRAQRLPIVEAFAEGAQVLVVGSSWEPDEDLLLRYINNNREKKMIIAPHEISANRIESICGKLWRTFALYTETNVQEVKKADCLIINTMGILSAVYQYGQLAYIGGGFGAGIHNTLEAATWQIPVVFGPNYHKFKEAQGLIASGAGFSIASYRHLEDTINALFFDKEAGKKAADYVRANAGATEFIVNEIF